MYWSKISVKHTTDEGTGGWPLLLPPGLPGAWSYQYTAIDQGRSRGSHHPETGEEPFNQPLGRDTGSYLKTSKQNTTSTLHVYRTQSWLLQRAPELVMGWRLFSGVYSSIAQQIVQDTDVFQVKNKWISEIHFLPSSINTEVNRIIRHASWSSIGI